MKTTNKENQKIELAKLLSTDVETLEKSEKIAKDICNNTGIILSSIAIAVHETDLPVLVKLYVMGKIVNWKTLD